ncbi:MAG: hypothetical protein KAJ09_14500 [Deltaproteobacteria bacterium]|nr:hypothetical protein [Deltaproteobacteria bacterium]
MRKTTECYKCPEGYALLDIRRDMGGRIDEKFSCVRMEDSSASLRTLCASQPEMKNIRCQIYECPDGYFVMGSHAENKESDSEGFCFSCAKA